jgi:hypothetical protein
MPLGLDVERLLGKGVGKGSLVNKFRFFVQEVKLDSGYSPLIKGIRTTLKVIKGILIFGKESLTLRSLFFHDIMCTN